MTDIGSLESLQFQGGGQRQTLPRRLWSAGELGKDVVVVFVDGDGGQVGVFKILPVQKIIDTKYFQDDGKGKLCFGDPALCRQSKNKLITMMLNRKGGGKGGRSIQLIEHQCRWLG